MLTTEQIERCNALWRQLYERGDVRWMMGMITRCGAVVVGANPLRVHSSVGSVRVSPADVLPNFNHPAVTGCLLAMAREATGDATLTHALVPGVLMEGEDVWCCIVTNVKGLPAQADNEPEALLLAIDEVSRAR